MSEPLQRTSSLIHATLRLRRGIRPVRAGRYTIWFLGGPRSLLTSGPSVSDGASTLLKALTDGHPLADALNKNPKLNVSWAISLLETLSQYGLLENAARPRPAEISSTSLFLDRFLGLVDPESPRPAPWERLVRCGITLDCDARLRSRIEASLLASGVGSVLTRRSLHNRLRPSGCTLNIKLAGRADYAHFAPPSQPDHRPALTVAHGTSQDVAEARGRAGLSPSVYSDGLCAALVAHWAIVAGEGLPVVQTLSDHSELMHTRPWPRRIAPIEQQGSTSGDGISGFLLCLLRRICHYAAGNDPANSGAEHKNIRRIAPSSGDLGSIHMIGLIPARGSVSIYYFSPESTVLTLLIRRRLDEAGAFTAITRYDACFALVASVRHLEVRYGHRAERLAYYDSGVTMDHVRRAAVAFGTTVESIPFKSSPELLAFLHLPPDDDRIIGTGLLGLVPVNRSHSRPTDEITHTYLRPMLERRSVRLFSERLPDIEFLHRCERVLLEPRYAHAGWRRTPSKVVLYRIWRDAAGILHGKMLSLDPVAQPFRSTSHCLPFPTMEGVVRQAGLARAPVHYLFACARDETSSGGNGRLRWLNTGELLSALWVEAGRWGIVGTICGNIDVSRLEELESLVFEPVALCLGLGNRVNSK